MSDKDNLALLSLLVSYQAWSGERVTNAGRAFDIVCNITHAMTLKSKKQAVNYFIHEGWGSSRRGCARLVDMIWSVRDMYNDKAPGKVKT